MANKTGVRTRRIRAWMVLRGLTQEKVAEQAGLSRQMVSYYVNGVKGSRRLTEYFLSNGCPPSYLGGAATRTTQTS